jgi:Protein of unknown function (DUF3551)
MRILAVAILTIGTVSVARPAQAQKYDPAFPVCMYVIEWGGSPHYNCSFTTMDQCRASASGRGLTCDPNPYYVGATASRGRHDKQYRRVY